MRTAAALLLLALLTAAPSPAADDVRFRILDFGPRGRITQRIYHDFDGDGRAEILLFSGKTVRVFPPNREGGYDADAAQELRLPSDALFFCVGQVDADERTSELAAVTPAGVVCHVFENGRFAEKARTVLRAESLVTRGQADNVHWRGFLQDLDGDGLADVVLATSRGFALYYQRREEGGANGAPGVPGRWPDRPDRLVPYTLRASLSAGSPGLTGRIHGTIGVPGFRVADFTADGRPDFAVDDGRSMKIHPAAEDDRPAPEAVEPFDLSPLRDEAGNLPGFLYRDVNGDGTLDFIVSRREDGVTETFLGGRSLEKPVHQVRTSGWSYAPILDDLDGDGRPDLIVPTTAKVGFLTAVRVVTAGSIEVSNRIYLNTGDADAPFRKQPDVIRTVEVRLRLYLSMTGQIQVDRSLLVDFSGDFDGDGRRDLIYREGTEELRFYAGTEEGVFSEDAFLRVGIPDTEDYGSLSSTVQDLNGDGRPDVAVYYRSRDRRGDRLVLLLSEKGKD